MIPERGSTIPKIDVEATHPDYPTALQYYRLYRDCYEAGGGFQPILKSLTKSGVAQSAKEYADYLTTQQGVLTWLIPHTREHGEDYEERLELAYLPNYVKHRGISPIVGYLTDKPPDRNGIPPELEEWMKSATLEGLDWDTWLGLEGIAYGLVYGTPPGVDGIGLLAVIDSDYHEAQTEAERIEQGAEFAKLRVIHPELVLDWHRNSKGELEAIKYKATLDVWDGKSHKKVYRYFWLTGEGWWYVDDDHEVTGQNPSDWPVVASGLWPWGSGLAPFAELRFLNGQSLLCDIAPLVVRAFNQLSELVSLQRKQCFSILCVQENKPGETPRKVGAGAYWGVDMDAKMMPAYVSPPMEPLTHLREDIAEKWTQIQELLGTASYFGASAEAAETLAYRFQTTQRFLQRLANGLVQFERKVGNIVQAWNGKGDIGDYNPVYTQTFDAVDIERFITVMDTAINSIGMPPAAKAVIKRAVIERLPITPTDAEMKEINAQLEMEADEKDEEEPGPTIQQVMQGVQAPQAIEPPEKPEA